MLQKEIALGIAVPINCGSLIAGKNIVVSGLGFGERPDHFVITAFVDIPDEGRGVTIPLALSEAEVGDAIKQMTAWLEKRT